MTVPLADGRLPPNARLRRLVSDLVQLRPILEDESRELLLELPGEPLQLIRYTPPEPDPERPLLFDDEIELQRGVTARVVVRRAAQPIPLSPARAARRGGLVVLSGRAAHETTLAGLEARPGARHLYGEVRCEAIERLQREALETPRPQVVVRVDRSGLNDAHPLVRRLYARLERILRPIVDAEERRAGARLVRAGKETAARDAVGLRALNDALRAAFDAPGRAGFARGGAADRAAAGRGAGAARDRPAQPAAPGPCCGRSTPRCASSSRRCGSIRASSAASRSSSTRRASRPGRRSRSPPTPASRSRSAPTRYPSPSRAAGRA